MNGPVGGSIGGPVGGPVTEGVRWRVPAVAAGLAVLAYGLYLLVTSGPAAPLLAVTVWLAGALVAHDALLAPLAVLAGAVVVRRVGGPARLVLAGGLLVATCLALVAVPALLTPGVPDNPTATPRDYPRGLTVLLALDVAATALLIVRVRRRSRQS